MANEIVPYTEMCQREGVSLQRGMNYELGGNHSVILMSIRAGAPYADRFEDDGSTIIYEGHDVPRSASEPNPKLVDQPESTPTGQLTENGKFHKAAQEFKSGYRSPERIRVYEKIRQGIWSYNGVFHLVDSWTEQSDGGKCSKCGATEDLHFDHIIPWSKGGSSTTADNVQLLCGRHNLEKHDRIE